MTFQTTVNIRQAFGVPGDLLFDGPQLVDSLTVFSNTTVSGNSNTVGFAYTKGFQSNIAKVGGAITPGTSVFAGILVNSKVYTLIGSPTPLSPSLNIIDNSQGEFLTVGSICVNIVDNDDQTGANINDQVIYNLNAMGVAVGALSCIPPGASAPTGWAKVPGAYVRNYPTTASGLIAITLTNINQGG